jgi:hypothetical protein
VPIIALLLAGLTPMQGDPSLNLVLKLLNKSTGEVSSLVIQTRDPLPQPKLSPKKLGDPPKPEEFQWMTTGYGMYPPDAKGTRTNFARFYVYSQTRAETNDLAMSVAEELQRLWEYNYHDFKLDQSQEFGRGVVEVFLCLDGKAGGEQLFDVDPSEGRGNDKVNTIYIYDIKSFTDPVEMAREVAHEYGHAFLAPIGGYTAPEEWANGYLGERIYLRHIVQEMDRGQLGPQDAMGATAPQLKAWLKSHVDPLVSQAAQTPPPFSKLKQRDAAAMSAFIGMALYIDTILPDSAFSRSMQMVGSTNAEDYPDSVLLAADELEQYTINVPSYLVGKAIWIPLGSDRLSGATVLRRRGPWALIQATDHPVHISHPSR